MLGLDPDVAVHRLNMDLKAKVVVQKKRMLVPKSQRSIEKELKRLKSASFIREM